MLCADARGAVGGDCVIPTRGGPEGVEGMDVFKKSLARLRWRNSRTIKIDILFAIVCAQTDHVALIGYDVNEFELPETIAELDRILRLHLKSTSRRSNGTLAVRD